MSSPFVDVIQDPGFDPMAIYNFATTLMENIVAVYAEYGQSLPTRQYLAVGGSGDTIFDDEQVTVSWVQGYSGLPGAQSLVPVDRYQSPRSGVFISEIVRITADDLSNNPPSPDDYNSHAAVQMIDSQLLMEAGLRAAELSAYGRKGIVDVSAGPPKGTMQAMILTTIVSV